MNIRRATELLKAGLLGLVLTAATASQGASVVTVDENHILVLNGRKVFPIGFSPGTTPNSVTPQGKDAMQEFRDAGALLVRMGQSRNWDAQLIAEYEAYLDWAEQHGMFLWLNLREVSKFAAGDTATEASLRDKVTRFKDHPALGVWKNYDEAWWGGVSADDLARGYNVIKELDANHPVVQTHAPRGTVADLQPYNAATDVLALDIYPVGYPPGANSLWANKEVSMVGDYALFLDEVGQGQKQYWLIEQIAWSGVTNPGKTLRFPTFTQSRYMAYQAIVNGARGLMFFGGNNSIAMNARDAAYGWNWTFWETVLRRVVQELGDKSPIAEALAAPNSTLPVSMSGTTAPDIEFCVREVPPHLYIIACKREGATIQATFSGLPTNATTAELLFESPRSVTATNGTFTDWFGPFEVHVYRFFVDSSTNAVQINMDPVSRTNLAGTTAAFTVGASGFSPLYRWRKDGVHLIDGPDISGSGTAMLALGNVLAASAGSYSVVVSNQFNALTSAPALLTVIDPAITVQPSDQMAAPGGSTTFSVSAQGTAPLAYRWSKNGQTLTNGGNISGATSPNLAIANIQQADTAAYSVSVSNSIGIANSASATLQVSDGLFIAVQPSSRTNNAGSTAQFTVSAGHSLGYSVSYQWFREGTALLDGQKINGASSPMLSIADVTRADAATYTVAVSSGGLSLTGAPATLTVIYPMPYYEPFDYPAAQNIGGKINPNFLTWSDVATSTSGPYVQTVAGNLSFPGLAASIGNSLQFGGVGKSARFNLPSGNAVSSGTLYYSLLFKVVNSTGLTTSGKFIAGFNNSTGTQTTQPTVIGTRLYIRSTGSGFNLGVAKNSSTASDWVWDTRVFTNNQTILIVGGYAFSDSGDVCSMWLDPAPGSLGISTAPQPSIVAATGSDLAQIASFVLFQRDPTEPPMMIVDELRIAPSWSGVTPPDSTPSAINLTGFDNPESGLFQLEFFNNTGRSLSVHASTNLTEWINLGAALQVAPGLYQFMDPMGLAPQRFYQLRWP